MKVIDIVDVAGFVPFKSCISFLTPILFRAIRYSAIYTFDRNNPIPDT